MKAEQSGSDQREAGLRGCQGILNGLLLLTVLGGFLAGLGRWLAK